MGTPRAIYCLGRQISCFSQSARVPFLLWCCSFYFRQHNVRICSFHNAEHIQHQDFLFRRSLLLLLHAALESNWGRFKFRLLSTGAFLQYKDHIDSGVTEGVQRSVFFEGDTQHTHTQSKRRRAPLVVRYRPLTHLWTNLPDSRCSRFRCLKLSDQYYRLQCVL